MNKKIGIYMMILLLILVAIFSIVIRQFNVKDNNVQQEQSIESAKQETQSSVNSEQIEKIEESESQENEHSIEEEYKHNEAIIYLTFDDGPSAENTLQILDVLKEKNVQATFFINNYPDELDYIVKRQYEEGHTIGLHGYSHYYSKIYTSLDAVMNNFIILQEKVNKTTGGYNSRIIRFPGGSSNTISKKYCRGIMSLATQKVLEEGFIYFDWNVDSGDAERKFSKDANAIYNNIISTLKPGKENVVLMHDSKSHSATRDIVGKVIDYGKENGYQFKAITEETIPVRHGVNN